MVGGFDVFADHVVQFIVGLGLRTGLNFLPGEGGEGGLGKDFAREADAGAEVLPVLIVGHVVEEDLWRVAVVA